MSGSETHIDDMDPTLPEPAPLGKSRQLIPKWLPWLLGGVSLLTLILFWAVPARPLTGLANWDPRCDSLEQEPWSELALESDSLPGLSRKEMFRLNVRYGSLSDGLVIFGSYGTFPKFEQFWSRVPAMAGQPLLLEQGPTPLRTGIGGKLTVWESEDSLWVPQTRKPTVLDELEMVQLDARTLEPCKVVPLRYTAAPERSIYMSVSPVLNAGVRPDGRWLLLAGLDFRRQRAKLGATHAVVWVFDPVSGEASVGQQIPWSSLLQAGEQFPQNELGILADGSAVTTGLGMPKEAGVLRVTVEDAGAVEPHRFRIPEPPKLKLPSRLIPASRSNSGWWAAKHFHLSRGETAVLMQLDYMDNCLPEYVHLQTMRGLSLGGTLQLGPVQVQSARAAGWMQSELKWRFQNRFVQPLGIQLATSEAGTLPTDPNLEQAAFATLETIQWLNMEPGNRIPGIWVWPVSPATHLIVQLVREVEREQPGGDFFRLGTISGSDASIQWLGRFLAPELLRDCRFRVRLSCMVEAEHLRFLVQAVEDAYPQATYRCWWTDVDRPPALEATIAGWLEADARYLVAWQLPATGTAP